MRKIIIIAMTTFIVLSASACADSVQTAVDEKSATIEEMSIEEDATNETETETEETVPVPSGSVRPMYFDSEVELQDVITGKKVMAHGASNPEHATSLEHYFVPENIPEDSTLSYITVHDANVVFCYEFEEAPDEWKSNIFLLEWKRGLGAGDMKKTVNRWFSEDEIEHYKHYDIYVYEVIKESTSEEFIRQDVYWEQNGYAFHAIVPIWFTKADIEKYCVARMVTVK